MNATVKLCSDLSPSSLPVFADQTLALVVLDLAAVLARQCLEARHVEAAGREHHAAVAFRLTRLHERDDAVDVVLDVDAGSLLEFFLALVVVLAGHRGVQLLAELRAHHVLDVGVGDEDGVGGHVLEFGRSLGLPECPHGHSCVVRHQPRAQPDEQHRHRAEHEVAGPLCHPKHVL